MKHEPCPQCNQTNWGPWRIERVKDYKNVCRIRDCATEGCTFFDGRIIVTDIKLIESLVDAIGKDKLKGILEHLES